MKIKLLKFLFFGGLTYLINLGLTYTFNTYLDFPTYFSYFLALILVAGINFLSSINIIFKSKYTNNVLFKYILFLSFFTLSNYIIVNLLVYIFSEEFLYYYIFIITTIFFFLKFIVYDKFVFKK